MKESNISQLIRLSVSKSTTAKVFRNNVGTGWIGKNKRLKSGEMLIQDPRPLKAGLTVGSSDLIGWTVKEITPEMVGKKIAIFTAIEVKKPSGRTSKEQLNFINNLRADGGIVGVCRSGEEAVDLINKF
jgi:hypothetical protein